MGCLQPSQPTLLYCMRKIQRNEDRITTVILFVGKKDCGLSKHQALSENSFLTFFILKTPLPNTDNLRVRCAPHAECNPTAVLVGANVTMCGVSLTQCRSLEKEGAHVKGGKRDFSLFLNEGWSSQGNCVS